jgi:hypothetical protein
VVDEAADSAQSLAYPYPQVEEAGSLEEASRFPLSLAPPRGARLQSAAGASWTLLLEQSPAAP